MKRRAVRWQPPLCAQTWQSEDELDAWIVYETWHQALNNEPDIVPLTYPDAEVVKEWPDTPVLIKPAKTRVIVERVGALVKQAG
jgi:hypothetical protein